MKAIIFLFGVMLFMGLVSATPQVFFSSLNATIVGQTSVNGSTNVTYHLWGESVDVTETFVVGTNYSFNFTRQNIPLQLSREMNCAEGDVAVLIHALAISNNMSDKWENCMNMSRDLLVQNLEMKDNIAYKDNYTTIKSQYDLLAQQTQDKNSQIDSLNTQVKDLGSQRWMIGFIAAALAGTTYYFWRKTTPKFVASPGLSQLPRSQRV